MNSNDLNNEYSLNSYNYILPEELIAKYPLIRGDSRLMVIESGRQKNFDQAEDLNCCAKSKKYEDSKDVKKIIHSSFSQLLEYLPEKSVLVANNSKVIPARILGNRPSGGKLEFLLLTPLNLIKDSTSLVDCLLKPGKAFKIGQIIELCPNLQAEIVHKGEYGQHQVYLHWQGSLLKIFQTQGSLPLPPYLKRESELEDFATYQTIYAQNPGSVAAPTAGLHFTKALQKALLAAGHSWLELTLHVGYGTFSPVRVADIRDHSLHAEFVELSAETALSINLAKAEGRPIIGIGTTSVRSLEGIAMQSANNKLIAHADWLNCFIYPGYKFKVIDGLITNFHLPESSLLMLVSAFMGREKALTCYAEAIARRYRFFSYGDAMLIK